MSANQKLIDNLVPENVDSTLEEIFHQELSRGVNPAVKPNATSSILGPTERLAPRSYDDLKNLMVKSYREKKRIKPYGAGYAFSTILDTSGIQYDLSQHLNKILDIETDLLSSPEEFMVRFEAGCTVETLNRHLWNKDQCLINQPGWEKLTYWGVANCGGHGSGITLGPLEDAILSIDLLSFNRHGGVVEYRIEPLDGITDHNAYKKKYPNRVLIQDDQYFNAVKVSFGTIGMVYSIIVKTQKKFYLEEFRKKEKWSDVSPNLDKILSDPDVHSIHVWLNPYKVDGENSCVTSTYKFTNEVEQGKRALGTTWGFVDELAPLLLNLINHIPQHIGRIINTSLKATENKEKVILKVYDAINFGAPNLVQVEACDIGIPYSETLQAVDSIIDYAEAIHSKGQYLTSPLGIRFTSGSNAYLAPQYGRTSCMIELPLIKGTEKWSETIKGFHNLMMSKHKARPHWGQRLLGVVSRSNIASLYPKYNLFKQVLNDINSGQFDGDYSDYLELRHGRA